MPPVEHCLRLEPDSTHAAPRGATILLLPPLFDEGNRMRRTLVLTMRALTQLGHCALLPDLPGQNDSLCPTEQVTLDDWRTALAQCVAREAGPIIIASWRGGALIDDAAAAPPADGAAQVIGWWRMAPVAGASIVRAMMRVRIAGEKEMGRAITSDDLRAAAASGPVELAGNRLNAAMLDALDAAQPAEVAPLRTVMPGNGEGKIPGTPLWLRAEPGENAAMARAMAQDISEWASLCAAG